MKYWRARFFLLPGNCSSTKDIIDGADRFVLTLFFLNFGWSSQILTFDLCSCDIYDLEGTNEQRQVESFLRFLEYINKIRRPGFTGTRPVSSQLTSNP